MLRQGGWYSTFELNLKANVTSASAAISELEANGYVVERRIPKGEKYKEYHLLSEPAKAPAPIAPILPTAQIDMFGRGHFGQAVVK